MEAVELRASKQDAWQFVPCLHHQAGFGTVRATVTRTRPLNSTAHPVGHDHSCRGHVDLSSARRGWGVYRGRVQQEPRCQLLAVLAAQKQVLGHSALSGSASLLSLSMAPHVLNAHSHLYLTGCSWPSCPSPSPRSIVCAWSWAGLHKPPLKPPWGGENMSFLYPWISVAAL